MAGHRLPEENTLLASVQAAGLERMFTNANDVKNVDIKHNLIIKECNLYM